jgi:hypothetical protein
MASTDFVKNVCCSIPSVVQNSAGLAVTWADWLSRITFCSQSAGIET